MKTLYILIFSISMFCNNNLFSNRVSDILLASMASQAVNLLYKNLKNVRSWDDLDPITKEMLDAVSIKNILCVTAAYLALNIIKYIYDNNQCYLNHQKDINLYKEFQYIKKLTKQGKSHLICPYLDGTIADFVPFPFPDLNESLQKFENEKQEIVRTLWKKFMDVHKLLRPNTLSFVCTFFLYEHIYSLYHKRYINKKLFMSYLKAALFVNIFVKELLLKVGIK